MSPTQKRPVVEEVNKYRMLTLMLVAVEFCIVYETAFFYWLIGQMREEEKMFYYTACNLEKFYCI